MRALVCVVFALCAIGAVAAVPQWQRADNPDFVAANKAQLDAISANPATDLWYQNIVIYAEDVQNGLQPVVNYGYWQSRAYNEAIGAFEEVQAWYRSETVLAFQQINSEVLRPEFTVSPDNGGVIRQDQGYRVYWTTNYTFDSAAVIGAQARSAASGSNVVRISFCDSASQVCFFTEELMTRVPHQRRRYTNTFTTDPSGDTAPLTIIFDSVVVPIEYQPDVVRDAFAAYRAGAVPKAEDPAAVAAGTPFNLVYLYTHPARAIADDVYYHGQPSFTLADFMRLQEEL